MKKLLLTTALVFLALPAMAQDNMTRMKMDTDTAAPALPEATGKINSIDAEKHSVDGQYSIVDLKAAK